MMKWVNKILFLLVLSFSTPSHAVRVVPSLFELSLSEIVKGVEKDATELSRKFDCIPWMLQRQFAEKLSDQMRAELVLLWYQKITNSSSSEYAQHYHNIICNILLTWFEKPYRIRQSALEEDLGWIEKARIPFVNASQLKLSPKQFARISSFSFLRKLNLSQSITALDVEHILRVSLIEAPSVKLPNLRILILNNCDLQSGFIVDWLRYMPNLVVLDATGNSFGEVVYTQLKKLEKLGVLILKNCSLNRRKVDAISEIIQLWELDLENNGLDPSRIGGLEQLVNLRHLSLADNSGITHGLDFLSSLPLVSLDLSGCAMRSNALGPLRDKGSLLHLRISNVILTDQQIKDVITLPNLKGLTMACVGLTSSQAKQLLAKQSLSSLRIPSNSLKTSAFENFSNRNIRALNLSHNPLGDEVIKILKPFNRIRFLNLEGCDLTDVIVNELKKMKHLKQVWLNQNMISEAAILEINSLLQSSKI